MWKRWSSKPKPAANLSPASEGDKVKATSPSTGTSDPVALEPSVEQEADSRHEDMTEGATGIPISVVHPSTPANGELEPPRSPAGQAPVPQNSSANTVQVSAGGVNKDAQASAELPDGPRLNISATENETAQSEPKIEENASNAEPEMDPQAEGNAIDMATPANTLSAPQSEQSHSRTRRLSFRSLAFFYGRDKQSPPISYFPSSPILKAKPTDPLKSKHTSLPKPKLSRSEKHALSSAIALRILIIGPGSVSSLAEDSRKTTAKHVYFKSSPSPNLEKLKTRLLKPKSANAVISQLRRLPLPDGPSFHVFGTSSESLVTHPDAGGAPIHAVCLASTDEEADEKHFSRLRTSHTAQTSGLSSVASSSQGRISVGTASLESLIPVLRDLRLVSLLASPDLGFGQPVSDKDDTGILAGSVPSAGAVVDGFEEITKQLMSLGFATSKAVFPSHAGIYPPEDRMSVLTCE